MPVRQTEGGQGSPGKRYLCEVYSTLAVIGMVRLLMDPSLGCQVLSFHIGVDERCRL